MDGPIFKATLKLVPELACQRLVASWRPTLSQGVPGQIQYGIAFVDAPQHGNPGQEFGCSFCFLAWPDPGCSVFVAGMEFVLHEGATVVARGRITLVDGQIGTE